MMKRTKVALVAGTAVLALAGIGGGMAFAAGGSSTPTAGTPTASTPTSGTAAPTAPGKGRRRGPLARTEHGQFTIGSKKGDVVIDVQRGKVTAVSATSITVVSKDGFTATYSVGSSSKVRKHKQASSIGAVATGDRVLVVAQKNGSTDTVRRINDAGPAK